MGSLSMWIYLSCVCIVLWLFIGIKYWILFLGSYNYKDSAVRTEETLKHRDDFMNATGYTFAEDKIKVLRWRRFIPISVIAVLIMPAIVIAAGITEFVDSL